MNGAHIRFEDLKMWLVREDGWRYPIEGILEMEWECSREDLFRWGRAEPVFRDRDTLRLTVGPVNDALLDTLRVLKDELPNTRLVIQSAD